MFLQKLRNRLAGNIPACRNVEVMQDDTFIVSYPRSGNTWMRFLLGKLLYNKNIDFINKEKIIPDIYKNSNKELLKLDRPRLLKSHEKFDYRYPKIIYIYRDGRDVASSYYMWFKKYRDYKKGLDKFLVEYTNGELDTYGRWDQHVNDWYEGAKSKNIDFLFLSYEDIQKNTKKELIKIVDFMGIERSDDDFCRAIEWANIDRMSKEEVKQEDISVELKDSRKDIRFIRKGNALGWREVLSENQQELLEREFGKTLKNLGYFDS